ncbi:MULTISPECIES: hypothetical protein [unclassified Leucobacter]|uniref:hypothetical protein n=1 Tax=unclassified Leucobacter TaxID=2621730 RepID=UPI00301B0708
MGDKAISVAEAIRLLSPHVSRSSLYKWIEREEVISERAPTGGAIMIRESEIVRLLAWYEGVGDTEVRVMMKTKAEGASS